jgi:hypothetical protein
MQNFPGKENIVSNYKALGAFKDDNIKYYQIFYLSFISLLLLINLLFQNGFTNSIIKRAWGLNNFSYFPWWVQSFVFAFLFVFAIPYINNIFRMFVIRSVKGDKWLVTGKFKKIICFTLISLTISILFYIFKVKYDLLGDMDLRVSQSVDSKFIEDEYFTMYFMHYLHIVLQKIFHFIPHQTFVFTSIAAGFFFCFLGLLIADILFKDIRSIIIFFLFYISIGNLLVFCGYTEIYAIPAVSVSLYIYTSLLFLKKKVGMILPFFCMVLAFLLHKEQISLLPSFIFLATRKLEVITKINVRVILILFVISIPLIYVLNAILHIQELMFLIKDSQFPQVSTLFSFSYWWELFNSQYISCGILIFLFILILFKAIKGQILLDDYSKFFLIATLFIYSIVITMNKMRGSGDWDVCSFPAIYLSIFVAYIALTQWKAIYSPRKLFYIISTALLLNLFSCSAWIGLNSERKSLNKIEDMLLTDPGWYYQVKLPSKMELSILFIKYGMHDRGMDYYKLSYEKYGSKHPNAVSNYVNILMHNKDTNDAVTIMENTVANHPYYFPTYDALFRIYEKRKQYNKVYPLAKSFVALYHSNPNTVNRDLTGTKFLIHCIIYLYGASVPRHDSVTRKDALLMMKQLHTELKPNS